MSPRDRTRDLFDEWYCGLLDRVAAGATPRGTIGAALVVLERLKTEWNPAIEVQLVPRKGQIRGVSGSALKRILAAFGENRPFLSEGGRTNRGVPGDIEKMLGSLKAAGLGEIDSELRTVELRKLQLYLVEKVSRWHSRKRLEFEFDPTLTAWETVRKMLRGATESGKEGPVAQYLIGAKLEIRFPDVEVPNFSFSTSDQQQGRSGDFHLTDTAFHVTVAPMAAVYERCIENLRDGLGVYLIVPSRILEGTRQNAEHQASGRISVDSIEAFVGGNIDEMAVFGRRKDLIDQFRVLLETYNARVDRVENDKSMMIEVPRSLRA